MENIEMTNMCMVMSADGKSVLAQNRVKGGWTGVAFPGGHVEPGESIVDSVVREVEEETGLTVSDLRIAGVKSWYQESENKRYMVFLFVARSFTGELIEHGEEGDVFWTPLNGVRSLNIAKGFEHMLAVFTDDALSELYMTPGAEGAGWVNRLK